MSDTIKSSDKTPTPVILDWDKAAQHIHEVTKNALVNSGKDNHNPHMWLNENVGLLNGALQDKDTTKRTPELHASIMALPLSPDTRIDINIPDKPVQVVPPAFLK